MIAENANRSPATRRRAHYKRPFTDPAKTLRLMSSSLVRGVAMAWQWWGWPARHRDGSSRFSPYRLATEPLESRQLLSGNPVITELMASNQGLVQDGDGRSPDWVEIHNAGDQSIDLAGYLGQAPVLPAC